MSEEESEELSSDAEDTNFGDDTVDIKDNTRIDETVVYRLKNGRLETDMPGYPPLELDIQINLNISATSRGALDSLQSSDILSSSIVTKVRNEELASVTEQISKINFGSGDNNKTLTVCYQNIGGAAPNRDAKRSLIKKLWEKKYDIYLFSDIKGYKDNTHKATITRKSACVWNDYEKDYYKRETKRGMLILYKNDLEKTKGIKVSPDMEDCSSDHPICFCDVKKAKQDNKSPNKKKIVTTPDETGKKEVKKCRQCDAPAIEGKSILVEMDQVTYKIVVVYHSHHGHGMEHCKHVCFGFIKQFLTESTQHTFIFSDLNLPSKVNTTTVTNSLDASIADPPSLRVQASFDSDVRETFFNLVPKTIPTNFGKSISSIDAVHCSIGSESSILLHYPRHPREFDKDYDIGGHAVFVAEIGKNINPKPFEICRAEKCFLKKDTECSVMVAQPVAEDDQEDQEEEDGEDEDVATANTGEQDATAAAQQTVLKAQSCGERPVYLLDSKMHAF